MSERFDDAVNQLSMAWRQSDGAGGPHVAAARVALEMVYADEKAEALEAAESALAAALAAKEEAERERDRYKRTWADMLNRAERAESTASALKAEVEALKEDARRDFVSHVAMVEALKAKVEEWRKTAHELHVGMDHARDAQDASDRAASALRERVGALAEEWEKEARSPGDSQNIRDTLGACAATLRSLLASAPPHEET